ncbi:hypothetical protein MM300_02365 [Evansella sp. LMS18]|uniref:hypothetical protein n=1 Tax=Evansella sp. LMS18 TaxID=2924033 RepID=UPI0020D13836|nr:hypothetical protein [Evansella sp. LMS18]UTR11197.1 hypothetical protein MM300_02365 [Evansella sp. LMS18]
MDKPEEENMKTLSLTSPLIKNYPSVHSKKMDINSTADENTPEKTELEVHETVNLLEKLLNRFLPFFFLSSAMYLFYICIQFLYFFFF